MTLSGKARLSSAAICILLVTAVDIAIHRSRHAMGKPAFLDMQARFFDRWYGTLHPAWSLVYGFFMVAAFVGVYELVSRGLMAVMRGGSGPSAGA
jgi:hypothetical protein